MARGGSHYIETVMFKAFSGKGGSHYIETVVLGAHGGGGWSTLYRNQCIWSAWYRGMGYIALEPMLSEYLRGRLHRIETVALGVSDGEGL